MTFWRWLMAQRNRDDRIGDISRDAALDSDAPHRPRRFINHIALVGSRAAHEAAQAAVDTWRREEGQQ